MTGSPSSTMTEFGRRVKENANGGLDHGSASFMFAWVNTSTADGSMASGPASRLTN